MQTIDDTHYSLLNNSTLDTRLRKTLREKHTEFVEKTRNTEVKRERVDTSQIITKMLNIISSRRHTMNWHSNIERLVFARTQSSRSEGARHAIEENVRLYTHSERHADTHATSRVESSRNDLSLAVL